MSLAPDTWNLAIRAALIGQYPQLASMYIANECLAGRAVTGESFLSFVQPLLSKQADVGVEARRLIGEIIALSDQPVDGSCIRPFMRPETSAEISLATEIVVAGFGWTVRLMEDEKTPEWLRRTRSERQPFLPWLCCQRDAEGWKTVDSLFSLKLTVPDDAALPAEGTLLEETNWNIQFQIDQLQIRLQYGVR